MVAAEFGVGRPEDLRSVWVRQAFELGLAGRRCQELLPGPPLASRILQAIVWAHFLGKASMVVKAWHPFFANGTNFHRGSNVTAESCLALGLAAGAPRRHPTSWTI